MLARASVTALFLTTPYVRSGGLGAALTNAPRAACVVALAITAGLCLMGGWHGLLALLAAGLVFGVWRRACQRRLGGFTGEHGGGFGGNGRSGGFGSPSLALDTRRPGEGRDDGWREVIWDFLSRGAPI